MQSSGKNVPDKQAKRRIRVRAALTTASIVLMVHGTAAFAQPRLSNYAATEYAVLHNFGASAVIRRINSAGEVAGAFKVDSRKTSKALIFLRGGIEEIPADPGVDHSIAFGINDQGEAVGTFNAAAAVRPYRAVRRVGIQELPLLGGDSGGVAYAVNLRGESVGYSSGPGGIRPVWWTRAGAVQPLQSLGGTTARALGLNDAGDVVGVAGDDIRRGVLWPNKGNPINLGTLSGYTHSEAVNINERGEIVGLATGVGDEPNRSHAVLWSSGGQAIRDLGTLSGGTNSRARDINARGEVVGASTSAHGDRAFIWTAGTGMVDLNTLVSLPGLVLSDALSINNKGQIVAVGFKTHTHAPGGNQQHEDHEGPRHVIVLTPAP